MSGVDNFRIKEILQVRTSTLFGAKKLEFFEIYSVSERTRGQCKHFDDKGEGDQFFAILCERLFWTAPYVNNQRSFKTSDF